MLACAVSGCTTDGQSVASFNQSGATLAFESIDGPPQAVFDRLVRAMDTEAQARSVAVVSRASPASYRVRGYVSAQVRRGRTIIAWVWDVYDRDQQRAMRLRGEEPAGKAGRDAWQTADDALLRRIATAGMTGIAGLLNGTVPAAVPDEPLPARSGSAIASAAAAGPGSAPTRIAANRAAFNASDR